MGASFGISGSSFGVWLGVFCCFSGSLGLMLCLFFGGVWAARGIVDSLAMRSGRRHMVIFIPYLGLHSWVWCFVVMFKAASCISSYLPQVACLCFVFFGFHFLLDTPRHVLFLGQRRNTLDNTIFITIPHNTHGRTRRYLSFSSVSSSSCCFFVLYSRRLC